MRHQHRLVLTADHEFSIMIHILHIIEVVEHIYKFFEHLDIFSGNRRIALGQKLDLIDLEVDIFKSL